MARATWKGAVLAESDETQMVEGRHYFPPESINREYFGDSEKHTRCGWKGVANYYHLEVDGQRNPDAAWYYPETLPKAAHIKGYVAFWRGVKVE